MNGNSLAGYVLCLVFDKQAGFVLEAFLMKNIYYRGHDGDLHDTTWTGWAFYSNLAYILIGDP